MNKKYEKNLRFLNEIITYTGEDNNFDKWNDYVCTQEKVAAIYTKNVSKPVTGITHCNFILINGDDCMLTGYSIIYLMNVLPNHKKPISKIYFELVSIDKHVGFLNDYTMLLVLCHFHLFPFILELKVIAFSI